MLQLKIIHWEQNPQKKKQAQKQTKEFEKLKGRAELAKIQTVKIVSPHKVDQSKKQSACKTRHCERHWKQ